MKEEIYQKEANPLSMIILIFILIISTLTLIDSSAIIMRGCVFFKIKEPLFSQIIYISKWINFIVYKLSSFYCIIILFALYGLSIKKKSSVFILICIIIQTKTQVIENILYSLKYGMEVERKILIIFIINIISEAIMYLLIYNIFKSRPFLLYKLISILSIVYLAFSIKVSIEDKSYITYIIYSDNKDSLGLLSLLLNYNFHLIVIIIGTIIELFKQRNSSIEELDY